MCLLHMNYSSVLPVIDFSNTSLLQMSSDLAETDPPQISLLGKPQPHNISCHTSLSDSSVLSHDTFHRDVNGKRALSEGPLLRSSSNSSPKMWQSSELLPPLLERHRQRKDMAAKGIYFTPTNAPAPSSQENSRDYVSRFRSSHDASSLQSCSLRLHNTEARIHSEHFPDGHQLHFNFVQKYQLEDELGSGGYGFVMTAYNRIEGCEVAVKFIIKDKVPEHAWVEDELVGRLPTEVVLLSYIDHENIVKCLDLFEDSLYFYLVQELHGSPWHKGHHLSTQPVHLTGNSTASPQAYTPSLSPSSSEASLPASGPSTPPRVFSSAEFHTSVHANASNGSLGIDIPKLMHHQLSISSSISRPGILRRPSHDLFECIEQSEHKRLTEDQARHVFAQVVDAVDYLDSHGIAHRDIKDENLVIDRNLKVKLIDFGSATAVDPAEPRPSYDLFYGTAAYASAEILQKQKYQAAPAEIWTLGVLLSYLLAGVSPFPSTRDAADGRIFLSEKIVGKISDDAMDLMRRCLDPNPLTRATVSEAKAHRWLQRT